jgi:hypothetical protein
VKTFVNRVCVEVLQLSITKFLCQDMQCLVLVGEAFSIRLGGGEAQKEEKTIAMRLFCGLVLGAVRRFEKHQRLTSKQ